MAVMLLLISEMVAVIIGKNGFESGTGANYIPET